MWFFESRILRTFAKHHSGLWKALNSDAFEEAIQHTQTEREYAAADAEKGVFGRFRLVEAKCIALLW